MTATARRITWLLRHGAEQEGLAMSSDGFVRVDDLLDKMNVRNRTPRLTKADIDVLVRGDKKKRYALKEESGKWYIRANQGHSLSVQVSMTPFQASGCPLVHGTFQRNQVAIEEKGLSPMSRLHVHMIEIDGPVSKNWSLIRRNCDAFVVINSDQQVGLDLQRSDNNVVLSPAIASDRLVVLPGALHFCHGFFVFRKRGTEVAAVCTPHGNWGFPKGKRNREELALACAYRELWEETGLEPRHINVLPGSFAENSILYYLAEVKP